MGDSNSRIYGNREDLSANEVCEFWDARAAEISDLKGVLLGVDLADNSAEVRNTIEKKLLTSQLKKGEKLKILDIGCGIGRWVTNLKQDIDIYHGIDFSKNFVKKASEIYKDYNNVSFFQMSAANIKRNQLLKSYDLIILNGICMYLNDRPLLELFNILDKLISENGQIYLQESISIMNTRLTLKNYYSSELHCRYNAVYRTISEYNNFIEKSFSSIIIKKTGLLLDKETGERDETNAHFWFIARTVTSDFGKVIDQNII